MPINTKDERDKLLALVKETQALDKATREQFQMGDKFRFIRDRLNALVAQTEENLAALEQETKKTIVEVGPDETIIYVYLYNAQGLVFKTWEKMLNPAVFYEHSVNRPIYLDKTQIEAFIRSKVNKVQHGYLALAIKTDNILPPSMDATKDAIGNTLSKVKEGSLHLNRLIAFVHNGHEYVVNASGGLEKK